MILRVFLFLGFVLAGIFGLVHSLRLPIDGLLLFLLILLPTVALIFGHYRYIGHMRSQAFYDKALRHLRFWRILLPWEVFQQFKIQITIEAGLWKEAEVLLQQAEEGGLDQAFLGGFRSDLLRRQGKFVQARDLLLQRIDATPPSLLRTGLLAQAARLLILHFPSPEFLRLAEDCLQEALELHPDPPYSTLLKAIKGELFLAQKKSLEGLTLLRENLDSLLASAMTNTAPTSLSRRFLRNLSAFFAHLTYSQQDEHQNPLFAEFCLSLARGYKDAKDLDQARAIAKIGLLLSAQELTRKPLQQIAGSLG